MCCEPGRPGCDLPEHYGPYTTAYNRFSRWAREGVWLAIFEGWAARSPQSLHLIDSLVLRAYPARLARKKKARITPDRPAADGAPVVDQEGLPVRLLITLGQASAESAAPKLLAGCQDRDAASEPAQGGI
jgi:transposase